MKMFGSSPFSCPFLLALCTTGCILLVKMVMDIRLQSSTHIVLEFSEIINRFEHITIQSWILFEQKNSLTVIHKFLLNFNNVLSITECYTLTYLERLKFGNLRGN